MSSDFGKSFVMARLPPLAWHQVMIVYCIVICSTVCSAFVCYVDMCTVHTQQRIISLL